jgi:flavin-dependent dehydrogenase
MMDVPEKRIDILIIGAGPAGCAAAISARQAGLKTMLIEASAFAHSAPGETLHPGVEPILKKLGVWDSITGASFHRHRGIWRESGEGTRTFMPYGSDSNGEWLGFQADRRILHGILQDAAGEAGAVFKEATTARDVIMRNGRVDGVVCKGLEIRARWVFDATGRRAWLARKLNLKADRSGPAARVRFGWKEGSDRCLEGQPLFRQRKDGWEWFAPLGDGRTAWVTLDQTAEPGVGRSIGVRHDRKAATGLDMTWRLHPSCAGPGYFLLGDAAALLDPASSNGVLRALMSGMLAADLAARILSGEDEKAILQVYVRWIAALYRHHVDNLGDLYRQIDVNRIVNRPEQYIQRAGEKAADEQLLS